jgi:cell division protein FtsL
MHSEHAGCLYVFCVSVCVCAYLCACLLVCVCVCAMFLAEGRHAVRIQQD